MNTMAYLPPRSITEEKSILPEPVPTPSSKKSAAADTSLRNRTPLSPLQRIAFVLVSFVAASCEMALKLTFLIIIFHPLQSLYTGVNGEYVDPDWRWYLSICLKITGLLFVIGTIAEAVAYLSWRVRVVRSRRDGVSSIPVFTFPVSTIYFVFALYPMVDLCSALNSEEPLLASSDPDT
ncbi:uncharacterized protein F4807DRAFT_404323 [Annulohypoxylon truncatum]|uniref:uncharacterized protein n=1 Tax=Annulohypoxylon truncatum TaxID=327061 RepID=UPI002007B4E0|nr:uncharacterized protein F4807DRAFT_404323 [Annulohypoxylon truncatum]KAI1214705.1 hypothetical protein F4807DRAFT_404323 [Annulohypoxylon truncatum]